ncbi:Gfo/Idh/MocA family oxidoreductase [Pedococcus sp. 5OH_020]|uniref:Gfo/Idh/MocA family oxidoreductase n=1 Tax=Pedococcus sp. 5OH_020 TaxID=2989814 RepID=UPI0022E9B066|nr:Gfo/Idh/MocA family oxidoreductase [Pedococcus sp. 5OH_020]
MTPVRIGVIGTGRIGTFHAQTLARRVPEADLAGVADARPSGATALAAELGVREFETPSALITSPVVDAIVIAATSTAHADLVVEVAAAGKAIFCEKPMAMTLADADRAIAAAEASGVPLQVGFNRRFAADFIAAKAVVDGGGVGQPQLLRSVTRDPGLANPGGVPPWTIFTQTLIHDFDLLNWMNSGAKAVEVSAMADALVAPDFKEGGLLDTAVVTIRYDNGAIAVAEANFSATYGYDVRAEVFGSGGMVTIGSPRQVTMEHWDGQGVHGLTARGDTELLGDAYAGEFSSFCAAVANGSAPVVTGADAKAALAIALACVNSVTTGGTVRVGAEASA